MTSRILPFLTSLIACSTLSLAHSAFADDDGADAAPAKKTATAKATPIEKRITDLHSKLKITTEQEDLWKTVAQEMRDSGEAFNQATRAREEKAKTMTAIDDLNSYADLTSMHADSMKKFVTVFTPLYEAMTDTQKKNADEIFRGHKEGKKKGMRK